MLRRKSLCDGGGIQIVITEPQVDELKYNVATGVFDEVRMIFPGRPSLSEVRKLEFLSPANVSTTLLTPIYDPTCNSRYVISYHYLDGPIVPGFGKL